MPTRRQRLTAALHRFSGARITQAEIGRRFGIKQPAVSTRLARYYEISGEAKKKWGAPVSIIPMQLSLAVNT